MNNYNKAIQFYDNALEIKKEAAIYYKKGHNL